MSSSIGRVAVLADWLVDRRWASLDFRDVAADIRQRINDAIQVCVNDSTNSTHELAVVTLQARQVHGCSERVARVQMLAR